MMEELHALHAGQHHFHEHSSDNDYDSDVDEDTNFVRRRRASEDRSFHSPSNGHGKLHHRSARQATNGDDLRSKSLSPLHHKSRRMRIVAPLTKKQTQWGKSMRWFIMSLVVGYFAMMFCGYLWMRQSRHFFTESLSSRSSFLEPKGRVFILRDRLEQKRHEDRNLYISKTKDNALKRAQRTRPPRVLSDVERYEILFSEQKKSASPSVVTPAKLIDLCGAHAKHALKANPLAYTSEHVLNSKSRVLITGILNPIGFHLALALKERCGVEIIGGIDPVFPNTVTHRLALQQRIEILSTNIPKLVQPILQPFVGLDPKTGKTSYTNLFTTGEINLLDLKYTHVVHLASYSLNEYQDFGDETLRNTQSPYVLTGSRAPALFAIRSSQVAMEQILLSLAEGDRELKEHAPQFIYASSVDMDDTLLSSTKAVDEILARLYSSLFGIYSNGLRFPSIVYGPWGRDGAPIHELSRSAINHHRHNNGTSLVADDSKSQDFVYVDDVVDAIIASMQYRDPLQSSSLLDLSSDKRSTLKSVSAYISRLVHSKVNKRPRDIVAPKALAVEHTDLVKKSRHVLNWTPSTPLSIGLTKTFAWYLDDSFPYGDGEGKLPTGDQLRIRLGIETCETDNLLCHMGRKFLPCLSECSIRDKCIPSIFDGVAKLVRELTDDCDVVLYMQALGYDVRDIKLKATYKEGKSTMVCNLAFLPEESRLVNAVIKKVPDAQLGQFGVEPNAKDSADVYKKEKLKGLNGRLQYKGWILVWVRGAHKNLAIHDLAMLKLSPGHFFASDVQHALYVDESFPVSPTRDDVLFLVGQLHRPPLSERNAFRKMENGKKRKYRLAAEPERRAVMLTSPLKYKRMSEAGEVSKISIYEATKYMQVEVGENPEKESSTLKKQREFYERVPLFVNRLDFRSINEAWYKYDMKHWVRTRWIVHDLKLAEAHQLRCDWFQEHIQWGNGLDQLSLAHVMMVRDLERRIAFQEPDDHVKPPWIEKPELLSLTDSHEWHALDSEENRMAYESLSHFTYSTVADHLIEGDEMGEGLEDGIVHSVKQSNHQDESLPLFVRVISERVMVKARLAWDDAGRSSK